MMECPQRHETLNALTPSFPLEEVRAYRMRDVHLLNVSQDEAREMPKQKPKKKTNSSTSCLSKLSSDEESSQRP